MCVGGSMELNQKPHQRHQWCERYQLNLWSVAAIAGSAHTVDREIFVVKIFSYTMAGTKIKRRKIMRVYNVNVVRGRLYENYLT